MDFLGLNSSLPETERRINFSDGSSVKQELQEQNFLRQLEESSDDDSECTVDCTLSLGSSSKKTKDSKLDSWTKIDQKRCSSSQVLGNYGVVNGGANSYIWGNGYGGSKYMSLLPEIINPSYMRDGYGLFGASSMAISSVYTNYMRLSSSNSTTPITKILQRRAKDTLDATYIRKCSSCETTTTPLWRNGPKGTKSLCNACGIRFRKEERKAMGCTNNNAKSKEDESQEMEQLPSKKPKN